MLNISTVSGAVGVAAALSAEGKTLVPTPNTPLAELVALSIPSGGSELVFFAGTDFDSMFTSFSSAVTATATGTLESPTGHDTSLDAYIRDISQLVKSHVGYSKDVVRGTVLDFAQNYSKFLDNLKPKAAAEGLDLCVHRVPNLLKDTSFLDTFREFQGESLLPPSAQFSLGDKTGDELAAMIATGHARTDEMVVEWFSHLPENYLLSVWNDNFMNKSSGSNVMLYVAPTIKTASGENPFRKMDFALALMLLTRRIEATVEETSLPLARYKDLVNEYTKFAGVLMAQALNAISDMTRAGVLVFGTQQSKLLLNGELYNGWLEQGGSTEVLAGFSRTGQSVATIETLNATKDQLLSKWNSYVMFFNTKEQNSRADYLRQFLKDSFASSLVAQDEIEGALTLKDTTRMDRLIKAAGEYIQCLDKDQLEKVHEVALALVAQIRFCHTPAYRILKDIDDAQKANPNVDVREAATLAVVNYVTDYFSGQVKLESFGALRR
jgi:hypothetical protein